MNVTQVHVAHPAARSASRSCRRPGGLAWAPRPFRAAVTAPTTALLQSVGTPAALKGDGNARFWSGPSCYPLAGWPTASKSLCCHNADDTRQRLLRAAVCGARTCRRARRAATAWEPLHPDQHPTEGKRCAGPAAQAAAGPPAAASRPPPSHPSEQAHNTASPCGADPRRGQSRLPAHAASTPRSPPVPTAATLRPAGRRRRPVPPPCTPQCRPRARRPRTCWSCCPACRPTCWGPRSRP